MEIMLLFPPDLLASVSRIWNSWIWNPKEVRAATKWRWLTGGSYLLFTTLACRGDRREDRPVQKRELLSELSWMGPDMAQRKDCFILERRVILDIYLKHHILKFFGGHAIKTRARLGHCSESQVSQPAITSCDECSFLQYRFLVHRFLYMREQEGRETPCSKGRCAKGSETQLHRSGLFFSVRFEKGESPITYIGTAGGHFSWGQNSLFNTAFCFLLFCLKSVLLENRVTPPDNDRI